MTESLCPICYKKINADIAVGEHVWMVKICDAHGVFVGMVERDPGWFLKCKELNCTNFYDGYLVDVTSRCNIKCKYCFQDHKEPDRTGEEIVIEARENIGIAPFILTGGEPTIHPELVEIVRRLKEMGRPLLLLTNRIRLTEPGFLNEVCSAGLSDGKNISLGLSFHKESNGKDRELLEMIRERKLKVVTGLWVIDELRQIDEVIEAMQKYRDVLLEMRIKAATNLWAENRAVNKIFVSDMLKYFKSKGNTKLLTGVNNKLSYANILFDGMTFILVTWYDRFNVDLIDINCGPYYKALDGKIYNAVTACILNEKYRLFGQCTEAERGPGIEVPRRQEQSENSHSSEEQAGHDV